MADSPFVSLAREQAQLLVVDIQERLLPHIAEHEDLVACAERMIRAAGALEMPATVSEQYPRGLGPSAPVILTAAAGAMRLEKSTFSFCADEACRARVVGLGRPQVLLVGIETHVCVQQTAFDLLALGMRPFVLADAVGSRRPRDHRVALDGMRAGGITVTTSESAIFKLVRASGTELFKRILPLVR
jgi:nicotinamidase-related amidase